MTREDRTERVLIVAPLGRDAAAIAGLLKDNGYCAQVCSGAAQAAEEAKSEAGVGALVLTEEALDREHVPGLLQQIGAQPAWSELPVIILTSSDESRAARLLDLAGAAAGSITLLERPLATVTLLRTVDVALRSRRRQYQVRDLLEAQRTREAALHEADRRKDIFLAILSHELRNPLTPIRNAAELLSSTKLTPVQLRWAQSVIRRQTEHMAALLDDLLDLARITQGKLQLRKQSCSLRGIVEAAVETARPIIESKRHQLSIHLPDEMPMLAVDNIRLAQAIANLLTNAAKYTDAGGAITLSARLEQDLVISVADNGIGIPAEQLGQLFTMFSQVASGNRSDGGLGIGLALVKGVIELHGGTVDVRSGGIGKGSEFIIRLPLVVVPPAGGESEQPRSEDRPPWKLRVLIADDNEDAAESLALLLSLEGHEVRTAYSGNAALSVVSEFRPDVALLDIWMPELDGFATAAAIRKRRGGAEVCLIAVTGWGQEADKRRAREAGFAMHLTKPVDPDRVRSVLRGLRTGARQSSFV
jgi:signal transduction histidine kinase/ActR/RegA family two-component response regulator